jgi:tetratricopeptide (TPR) repeat protein
MQTSYEPFSFSPEAGRRWIAYWTASAGLARREEDDYYFYELLAPVKGEPPVTWPGIDQQFLAATDGEVNKAAAAGKLADELPRALEVYGRVAREPGCPAAFERLGGILLQLGRAKEARAAFLEAERRGRKTSRLCDSLAVIEANAGRLAAAVPLMQRAIGYDPGNANARRNLAYALVRLGRGSEAIAVLREGLARDQRSPELLGAWQSLTGKPFQP